MATTKKAGKRTSNNKRGACPCGYGYGDGCNCTACDSVKYTGIWAAWRAFWRRGFTEWAGTSSRSEYWLSWVGNILVVLLFGVAEFLFAWFEFALWGHPAGLSVIIGFAFVVYLIAAVIPAISMLTRRMHDSGLSAWVWVLYIFGIVPACIGGSWVCGAGVGLVVSLLPTVVIGNRFQKNNKRR